VRTYVAGIVAEARPAPRRRRRASATAASRAAPPSGGNTTTASLAPAVKDAAAARSGFADRLASTIGAPAARLRFSGGKVADEQDPARALVEQACGSLGADGLSARGPSPELSSSGVHGAQAARSRSTR
jgi:hypothetical protein